MGSTVDLSNNTLRPPRESTDSEPESLFSRKRNFAQLGVIARKGRSQFFRQAPSKAPTSEPGLLKSKLGE